MSFFLIGIMIPLILMGICSVTYAGHISSWNMKSIQGSTGAISSYKFYANFDSGLGGNEYLHFIFPRNIGLSSIATITQYEKGTIMVSSSPVASYFVETGPLASQYNYFFKMKTQLLANEWYEIVIDSITTPSVTQLYQDPIQLQSVSYPCSSASTCTPIIYDSNHAFSLLYDELPTVLPVMAIALSFDTSNSYQTTPGATYGLYLDITPSISDAKGAIYQISIEQTFANSVYGISKDFKFRGACNSQARTCSSSVSCIPIDQVSNSSCEILKTFTQITFMHNDAVVAGQTFRIRVEVENPAYVSQRDLLVFSTGNSVGLSLERQNLINALKTAAIGIQPSKLWYLWGIADGSTLLRDDMPYALFRSASNIQTLNSVKIGFSVDDVLQSSESQSFIVTVGFAQASEILSSSIQTNLPRSDSSATQPDCYGSISGLNRIVVCEKVGPLSRDNQVYFIAAKVYFASSVPLKQTGFGAVSIVLSSAPTATLYTSSTGVAVTLNSNTEFLDNAGYHSSQFGFGTTQIVSMSDDKSLSSTADGISNLISSTRKNTAGITPQVSDQQLIFLIKATESQFSGLGSVNPSSDTYVFRMSVLFNPGVVKYETSSSTLGIDFAAFSKGSGPSVDKWNSASLPCIVAGTCKNYYNSDAANYPRNIRETVAATTTSAAYNILRFECQTSVFSSCANWRGYDLSTSNKSGVFSMRRVYFDSGFHSQIQADDQVLDFVIAFQRGLVTGSSSIEFSQVSAQLINAYTISANNLAYTKFSYVNFSDRSINPGNIMPTFLRISGLASSAENLGATAIAVFFDADINLNAFYDNYDSSGKQINRKIGCSSGSCVLYDSTKLSGKETWMNNKMVLVTQLKSKMESELNILIPVQNTFTTSVVFPKRLTIAFCSFSKLSNGLRNQLKVLSAYRAFGATTAGDITSSIQPINRLDLNLFSNTLAYSSEAFEAETGYTSKYTLTASDVKPKSSTSTLFQSDSPTTRFPAGTFDSTKTGAGVTITSINYNVFKQSTLGFNSPPYGVATKCQQFSYVFNNALSIPACADFDQKRIYTVFCPVDNAFSTINTANGNIVWKTPYFDTSISANTKLSTIFHYAFSSSIGKIFSLTADPGVVSSANMDGCTIYDQLGSSLVVSSTGSQTMAFGITVQGAINLDPIALSGYGFLRIEIAFSASISLLSFISNICTSTSHALILTCSFTSTSTSLVVQFTPLAVYQIQYLEQIVFNIPVKTTSLASPIANLKYTYSVKLPMSKGGVYRVYGDQNTDPTDTYVLFAQCSSGNIIFVSSPYGKLITLADLKFEIANVGARTPFNFTLTLQNRDVFSASSYFKIDFGFIREGNSDQLAQNNFRCVMYESTVSAALISSSQETYVPSWRWQTIVYDSNLQNVRIYPKTAFANPNLIKFLVKCYGGVTPISGAVSAEPLQVKWIEGSDTIQETGTTFTYPSSPTILTADKKNSVMSLTNKVWSSSGFEAIYSFTLTPTSVDLSFYSKIYIEFPYYISPGISLEKHPECYIRYQSSSSTIGTASESTLAVCEVIGERRLSVWCNKAIPRGNSFKLDIFGVQQSSYIRMNTLSQIGKIFIAFDIDTLLSTGISEFNYITDELPPITGTGEDLSPLTVLSVSQSSQSIRSTFDLTITYLADSLTAMGTSMYFYIRFSLSISTVTVIGQNIDCTLTKSDLTTNLATSCLLISPRNIQITRNSVDASQTVSSTFILTLTGLPSPNYVPESVKNIMNVLVFNSITQTTSPGKRVGLIGVDYQAKPIQFIKSSTLTDLCWRIFGFSRAQDQNNSWVLSEWLESNQQALVYIGYYKKRIRLQPEQSAKNVEQTYAAALNFTFDGSDTSLLAFSPTTFKVLKGASNLQLLIAAKQTTPPGIHLLKVTTVGDKTRIYETVPQLQVIVSGDQCQISPKLTSYNIPVGGMSLPIELDFYNCMPVNDVVFTPLFSSTTSLASDTNYQVNVVNQTTKTDGLMYFVIRNANGQTSTSGTTFTMSFSISGTNGASYSFPSTITLLFEDASSSQYTPSPTASSIAQTAIKAQSVVLSLECSQPGLLYWAYGPYNSLSGLQVNTVTSALTGASGFMSIATLTSTSGIVTKYGAEIIYATTILKKQFTNLQVNTKYDFKYFCVNQMGLSSGIQSTTLTTKDDGSALLKLTFKFDGLITFEQQNNLACAIQSYLGLSENRVRTDIATTCGVYPNYNSLQIQNLVVRSKASDSYEYYFYIVPASDEVTLSADPSNTKIRETINKSGFLQDFLLTSSANKPSISALPSLDSVNPDDSIVQIADPQLQQTRTSFTSHTISYQYLTLKNISGFIIVGLEEGTKTTSPSAEQIKKGVNSSGMKLVTFEVRVAQENTVQEFKFIQLEPGTKYTAYFIGSNDDPSSDAVVSGASLISFQTSGESYTTTTVTADRLINSLMTILFSSVVLIFLSL